MDGKKIYLMRPFVGEEELEAVRKVFELKYLTEVPVPLNNPMRRVLF